MTVIPCGMGDSVAVTHRYTIDPITEEARTQFSQVMRLRKGDVVKSPQCLEVLFDDLLRVEEVSRPRRRPGGPTTSAGAARELGSGSGELRREAKKPAAVSPFHIGQSRRRPLGFSDELLAVDGPAAKSQSRDRVNGLPVQ